MNKYIVATIALMISADPTSVAAAGCTTDSALASYRNAEICGAGGITPKTAVIRAKSSDQAKLEMHFARQREGLQRFVIDNCPGDTVAERDLRAFIAKKAEFCKNGCGSTGLNGCLAVCEYAKHAENDSLSGYLKATAYMTTAACSRPVPNRSQNRRTD